MPWTQGPFQQAEFLDEGYLQTYILGISSAYLAMTKFERWMLNIEYLFWFLKYFFQQLETEEKNLIGQTFFTQ